MAYTITTTNGSVISTVADGTVDSTSISLTLIGKNYAGYGIFLNENYVQLLENFANSAAPLLPLNGQIWFDSAGRVLKVYDASSTQWKSISASSTAPTAPVNSIIGDLWWDTANSQLKASNGITWVLIGPSYTASAGQSGALVETIIDTTGSSHAVINFYIQNLIMSIVSKDLAFTPQTSIPGYATINPGINLVSSSTVAGAALHGDVTNALAVGGISWNNLLRNDQSGSISGQLTINNNNGLVVGGGSNFNIAVDASASSAVNLTQLTPGSDLNCLVSPSGVATTALSIVGTSGKVLLPITLASTTTSTGALVVAGGVGIGGALNIGGDTAVSSTTNSTTSTTGALVVSGGVGIGGALTIDGVITAGSADITGVTRVLASTVSTNTTSGALIVTGGVGISGTINCGDINAQNITGNVTGVISTTVPYVGPQANLTVSGFANISGKITANANTISTSTTTGTFVVTGSGGIGVGGSIYATNIGATTITAGNIYASGNIVSNIGSITSGFNYLYIGNIMPMSSNIGNIGSPSSYFNRVFATSTSAQYADLAERFSADAIYSPGTIVQIGGVNEITLAVDELSDAVLGVISTNPAYTMNDTAGTDITHPAVALSGRVPVNVIGTVQKGDRLVCAGAGLARAAVSNEITPFNVIGRSLVDKKTTKAELILAIVKLNT